MFVTRLISGICLVAAALFLFAYGGVPLIITIACLSLVGSFELYRVLKMEDHPIAIASYITTIVYYVLMFFGLVRWTIALIILLLIVIMVIYVLDYPKVRVDKVALGFMGFVYVSLSLSCIYQTRALEGGHWFVWMIIIGSWGSDTCAYVVGRLFGKHNFSELSPKKTIEGCVGGVVGAGLIAFLYSLYFPYGYKFVLDYHFSLVVIAMLCALISQFGDLAASAIKRNYDVKDYGKIIPGHGGVLDRFDSVIFVAPFVYYLLILVSTYKLF
ncbi:MAG: phosphatidate cytidylyltransferase [Eubacterium sp.]|nr:phosphatidate cytidylyltransferase [Eubacterium sp.]